jgi:WhiB family redox-sensing transcriptional regulator
MGPSLFYADGAGDPVTVIARRVCAVCPVAKHCLVESLIGDEQFGVWAGTTPRERQVLRRRRSMTRQGAYAVGPRPRAQG